MMGVTLSPSETNTECLTTAWAQLIHTLNIATVMDQSAVATSYSLRHLVPTNRHMRATR